MPQPTSSDVHVNRPLTTFSVAYIQDSKDFVADKLFPILPVMKQSDRYYVYVKDYWFRSGAAPRAPASESAGGGYVLDNTPTYSAQVIAWHFDIDDQTRANYDEPLDADRDGTYFVTQQLLLRREMDFMNRYMVTGVWQGFVFSGSPVDFQPNVHGQGYWTAANSNPVLDVDNIKSQVKSQTAYYPNAMVVTDDIHVVLKNNLSILDRIKYTQRAILTEDLLAVMFGIDKYLKASAVLNIAQEGQTGVFQFIKTNMALLVYANPQPTIMMPSAGYTFAWKGLYGSGAFGNRISKFRMEWLKSDRVEGEMAYDMKIVGLDLGVLIINIKAP